MKTWESSVGWIILVSAGRCDAAIHLLTDATLTVKSCLEAGGACSLVKGEKKLVILMLETPCQRATIPGYNSRANRNWSFGPELNRKRLIEPDVVQLLLNMNCGLFILYFFKCMCDDIFSLCESWSLNNEKCTFVCCAHMRLTRFCVMYSLVL